MEPIIPKDDENPVEPAKEREPADFMKKFNGTFHNGSRAANGHAKGEAAKPLEPSNFLDLFNSGFHKR